MTNQRRIYQVLAGVAAVVCCAIIGLVAVTSRPQQPHAATTASVTTPSDPSVFPTPSAETSAFVSGFEYQPNWHANDKSSTAQRSALLASGDTLRIYAKAVKYEVFSTGYIGINYWSGSGALISKDASDGSNGTITGVATNNSSNNDNIVYDLTAPIVTSPTWYYYQLYYKIGSTKTLYSQLFKLLVVPASYAPSLTVDQAVIFTGQTSTISVADLTTSIVPTYSQSDTSVGTATANGNTMQLTANGTVGQTTLSAAVDLSSGPTSKGTASTYAQSSPSQTAYTGNIADQTAYQGGQATFSIDLPSGLTASNISWYHDGTAVSGETGTSLTLKDVQESGSVYATMTVKQGSTTVASQVTSNQATLTVKPWIDDFTLLLDHPTIFVNNGRTGMASVTDTAQASTSLASGTAITWHAYEPGTTTPSPLATVDATGKVSATGDATGTVEIVATAQDSTGAAMHARTTLTVTALDDPSGALNTTLSLSTGLTAPSGYEVYAVTWYRKGATSTGGQWKTITATDPYSLGALKATDDQDLFQYKVRYIQTDATNADNLITMYSNVAQLAVLLPNELLLDHVPAMAFGKTDAAGDVEPLTVQDLMAGFPGNTALGGTDWLTDPDSASENAITVTDKRSTTPQPWTLTVKMGDFINESTDATFTGSTTLVLKLVDGTQVSIVPGVTTTVIASQTVDATTDQYSLGTNAYLKTGPDPSVTAGNYEAKMTWT